MRVGIAVCGTGWVNERTGEPRKFDDWESFGLTEFPDGFHFSYALMIDDGKMYLEAYQEGLRLIRIWADQICIEGIHGKRKDG